MIVHALRPLDLDLCDCCGYRPVLVHGEVEQQGVLVARYRGFYFNHHSEESPVLVVELVESGALDGIAAAVEVWAGDEGIEMLVRDPASLVRWPFPAELESLASRTALLSSPRKAAFFETLESVVDGDPWLESYFARSRCSDGVGVPLEPAFKRPDAYAALNEDDQARPGTKASDNFSSIDGKRHFVRCLMPIPVEGRDPLTIGLWVEVDEETFGVVFDSWDDDVRYPSLRFSGSIANSFVVGERDLMGAAVVLAVPSPSSRPAVVDAEDGEVARLVTGGWSQEAFLQFARDRHLF